jgi:hypothetical protein
MAKPVAALMHAIEAGQYDHSLDRVGKHIVEAIAKRQRVLGAEILETLEPGNKVKILGPLRPKYFVGRFGVVDRIADTTVWVTLNKPITRYRKTHTSVGVPAWKLEVLD